MIRTLLLVLVFIFGVGSQTALAQESPSVLYVPLIGITSVPSPLALPKGPGNVTYKYAVKNFLREMSLSDIQVTDDKCSPVSFSGGDDNHDSLLDYNETWRYTCTTRVSETTQSVATATGKANNITATHKAYASVVVGFDSPPPLVSVVNITKIAHPLSLPEGGGEIVFTYRVNNPGVLPLSGLIIRDNKCSNMSGKLGDVNANNLLDINEAWIYTCKVTLTETTTNTVRVTAFAGEQKAIGEATVTVEVDIPPGATASRRIPGFPNTGMELSPKISAWLILSAVLAVLSLYYILKRRRKPKGKRK